MMKKYYTLGKLEGMEIVFIEQWRLVILKAL
jgi:hypothetical protein